MTDIILAETNPLAADLLAALIAIKAGAEVTGRWLDEDANAIDGFPTEADVPPAEEYPGATWAAYEPEEQNAFLDSVASMAASAIAKATLHGQRAQSFAERERDLLAANNVLLESEREWKRRALAAEEHDREATFAYTAAFISMAQKRTRMRQALMLSEQLLVTIYGSPDADPLKNGRGHDLITKIREITARG